jgi:hypothetical protein
MWEQGEPVPGHKPREQYGGGYGAAAGGYGGDYGEAQGGREYIIPEGDGDWPRAYGRVTQVGGRELLPA